MRLFHANLISVLMIIVIVVQVAIGIKTICQYRRSRLFPLPPFLHADANNNQQDSDGERGDP